MNSDFMTNPLFWAYALVMLPFFLFVIFYAAKSPWNATGAGRALMILAVTLNVVLINTLLSIAFGDYVWKDVVRIVVIGGSLISGWYLLITLVKLQYQGRRVTDSKLQHAAPPENYDHSRSARRQRRLERDLEL